MHRSIARLAQAPLYTEKDLLDAEEVFSTLGPDERRWFIEQRLKIITSSPRGDARSMATSGYQNGVSRRYYWGPCFSSMSHFFDVLRYGKAQHIVYMTHYERNDHDPWHYRTMSWDPPYQHAIMGVRSDCWSRDGVVRALDAIEASHIGLVIIPSVMEIMIREGFDPSLLDPDRYEIHSTGEPLLQQADPFASHGLKVKDNMRCWDGGATFFTCDHGHRHWIDMISSVRLEDHELISTDLFNVCHPFIEYRNGDCLSWNREGYCLCGRPIDHIQFTTREQRIECDGHLFQHRQLYPAFEGYCRSLGVEPNGLQIGIDEEKKVLTLYGQTKYPIEVDGRELQRYVLRVHPWLEDWEIRYSSSWGKKNFYKSFSVFRERVEDSFEAL